MTTYISKIKLYRSLAYSTVQGLFYEKKHVLNGLTDIVSLLSKLYIVDIQI